MRDKDLHPADELIGGTLGRRVFSYPYYLPEREVSATTIDNDVDDPTLRTFAKMAIEYRKAPDPVPLKDDDPRGAVVCPTWKQPKELKTGKNEKGQPWWATSGEIHWLAMHHDPEWPCPECKHKMKDHEPVVDFDWCNHVDEDGKHCNCGNNVGR